MWRRAGGRAKPHQPHPAPRRCSPAPLQSEAEAPARRGESASRRQSRRDDDHCPHARHYHPLRGEGGGQGQGRRHRAVVLEAMKMANSITTPAGGHGQGDKIQARRQGRQGRRPGRNRLGRIGLSGQDISREDTELKNRAADARAGDIVIAQVDLVFVQDTTGPLTVRQFEAGLSNSWPAPAQTVFFLDHAAPSPNRELANDHRLLRSSPRRPAASSLMSARASATSSWPSPWPGRGMSSWALTPTP